MMVREKRKPRDDVVEGAHDETLTRDGGDDSSSERRPRLQAGMASTIAREVKSAARRGEKEGGGRRGKKGADLADPRDAVEVGVQRAVRMMGGRN